MQINGEVAGFGRFYAYGGGFVAVGFGVLLHDLDQFGDMPFALVGFINAQPVYFYILQGGDERTLANGFLTSQDKKGTAFLLCVVFDGGCFPCDPLAVASL